MTHKIGVIGDGHVGATVAHQLIVAGLVDDLVLIDEKEDKANADALDFEDAMANLHHHANITVNDYSALKDAEIIVSAVGDVSLSAKDRFGELKYNKEHVSDAAAKIKASGFDGIIICISNPVDVITSLYQEVTGLPKDHVFGTGTLLDTARMKRAVGKRMNVDPRSVQGFTLGEHGNSQFTAWSTVKVLEQSMTEIAQAKNWQLSDINEEIKQGGYTVYAGKQYTNFGIAAAAVHLVEVVESDSRTELPVSNYLEKYDTYMSYPAVVGRDGIVEKVTLPLTTDEEQQLQHSADTIKEKAAKEF
ncbi:L-lactate dehydrogenase [Lactobacillus sp. ESL0684]|uniref:L-lactate dehydrogenase n=1 Tax=unclassified Lactobacillus TaxID=2620435 RepID=UPI0023F89513|nr:MULTISPECIES: L-lactate dehydrogenase [unclassified Lactobacillus]WEV40068.1 L-lactate dehydrogenase [Lactobacillus sp. ESL0681]WEV43392.1 L-lactate dehydrogenase [Lactobacillus sp. ESL0684]